MSQDKTPKEKIDAQLTQEQGDMVVKTIFKRIETVIVNSKDLAKYHLNHKNAQTDKNEDVVSIGELEPIDEKDLKLLFGGEHTF